MRLWVAACWSPRGLASRSDYSAVRSWTRETRGASKGIVPLAKRRGLAPTLLARQTQLLSTPCWKQCARKYLPGGARLSCWLSVRPAVDALSLLFVVVLCFSSSPQFIISIIFELEGANNNLAQAHRMKR